MKVLEISTAMGCPMRCGYCPQEKADAAYHGPRLMSMGVFKAALANAIAGGVEMVSFAGFAEPFLNLRCLPMMGWTAMHGLPQVLYTTCVGMTTADVCQLVNHIKPRAITIHLPDGLGTMKYSPTPQYRYVVQQLVESPLDVRLMAMGSVHPAVADIVAGRDVGGLESMQTRAGNVACMPVRMSQRGPLKCGPAPELDHPVLLPDGSLAACCQDWALEHVLGNLATQTWAEIFSGEPFRQLTAAMQSEGDSCLCRRCEYAVQAPIAVTIGETGA